MTHPAADPAPSSAAPARRIPRGPIAIVATVLAIIVGAGVYGTQKLAADLARRSAQADPQVQYTAVTWDATDGTGEDETRSGYDIAFSFSADGRQVTGARAHDELFRPGDAYIVCYNPIDPSDHGFYPAGKVRCGGK